MKFNTRMLQGSQVYVLKILREQILEKKQGFEVTEEVQDIMMVTWAPKRKGSGIS